MKKIIFFLLFIPFYVFSQQVKIRRDFDLVACDKSTSKIYFYKKRGGKFQKENETSKVTLEELKRDFVVYDLHKIKSEKESDYINSINNLQKITRVHQVYEDNFKKYVFVSLNPYIAILQETHPLEYKCKKGSFEELININNLNTFFLRKLIVKIAHRKYITLFYSKSSYRKYRSLAFCYLSFPHKTVLLGQSSKLKSVDITKNKITQDEIEVYTNNKKYKANIFFNYSRNKNGQCRLIDRYKGFTVLKKNYDSINFHSQMIVAYSGDSVEVYNPNFKKHVFQKPQKIYFKNQGYEILTDTDAFCMHQGGYKVPKINYYHRPMWCSNGDYHKSYKIEKSTKVGFSYKIQIYNDRIIRRWRKRFVYLTGLPEKFDSISFLNRKQTYFCSRYKDLYGKGYTNKILVYKGDKMGLYSFNLEDEKPIFKKKITKHKDTIINGVYNFPPPPDSPPIL